jgi:hypothetical protein
MLIVTSLFRSFKRSIEAITEDDMEHMSIKRGHRRVLQRALSARGTSSSTTKIDQSLPTQPVFSLNPSESQTGRNCQFGFLYPANLSKSFVLGVQIISVNSKLNLLLLLRV